MKSLRTRMTIMIVSVVLGISVLLSFISYQRAKSSLIAQMEDNYAVAAQKYALELSSWVSTNATIIDTMAAEIAVNDISEKDYDAFHQYLKHSNELLNKQGYVYDVYFTYPDNYMVCASDFTADGTVDFVHEREWYTTSALTGELFFSAPYLDSDTGKPVITISKAVYKEDRLLGVLAADIFVDVLVEMIHDANVGENSYAFLMDKNMRMIAHPNSEYDYEDNPIYIMGVLNSPYGRLVDTIEAGIDDMVFVNDYDGVVRGISYSRMINTGWYVCIATSKALLESGVSSLMRGFVLATVLSIIIGVLIAVFLARVLDKLSSQEQEYKERVLKLEKQAADEASRAKSRFLADMSHEIRTPINAIIGMNEMIMREAEDNDIAMYARNIKQSGNNLLQLINGILDFSKIEDGKMEIVPVRYSLRSQIEYFKNSISDRAEAKGLEVDYDIDPNLPCELCGDDTRINQVVMNLLTNAVKYTEKGLVTLKIEDKGHEDGKVRIYFEVKDTGIGIRESDMEKLFESFERLDVVRNRNIEGTGLGMAITVNLLKLMGSELKVESTYGVGSTFSFELVLKIEDETPVGDHKKTDHGTKEQKRYRESFHAPSARILVVDDTEMNILVVTSLLKKTEIKIDTATSGPDSVALADRNRYDVILMDQRMPGMDGAEAMRRIRALSAYRDVKVPIICLTADGITGARERYLKLGFDDYLTKPIEGEELEKILVKYLPSEKVEKNTGSDDESTDNDTGRDNESTKSDSVGTEAGDLLSALKKAGVDTKSGMAFCGHDEDTYRAILGAFVREKKNKSKRLRESYKDKDWEEYETYVHALKSTSRTIGAKELSDLAAGLEEAAGSGNTAFIDKNHYRTLDMYEQLVSVLRDSLGGDDEEEAGQGEDKGADKGVILEFEPV